MITQEQLFAQGWALKGFEEDDTYYVFYLLTPVFHQHYLSGNISTDGTFIIYGLPTRFSDIEKIQTLMSITCMELDESMLRRAVKNNWCKNTQYGEDE